MSVYINMYLLILCITSYLTKMGDDAADDVDDDGEKKIIKNVYIYLFYNVIFFFTIIITARTGKCDAP